MWVACDECGGAGAVGGDACPQCFGSGKDRGMERVTGEFDEIKGNPAVKASFECDLDTQEGREYALNALRATSIIWAIQEVDNRLRSAERRSQADYRCANDYEREAYCNVACHVRSMMREVFDDLGVSYVWEV